jgi:AcrR family transcriptional regulator
MTRHSTRPAGVEPRPVPVVDDLRPDQRERRDRIVAATARLLASVDYDRLQVKDVADEAGVALGTLYRYFHSKDHLAACALLAWSDGFGERIERRSSGSTRDRVAAIYRRAARAFERDPKIYAALVQVQASADPHAAQVVATFEDQQSAAFGEALDGYDSPRRDDVLAVMGAVLDGNLRAWQLGRITIGEVHRSIDRAASLIFDR